MFLPDPATGHPRIHRHDVSEAEVEEVLARRGEDRPGHGGGRVALGRTLAGRPLRVIYAPDPADGSLYVLTAFQPRGKPFLAYLVRARRRARALRS